MCCIIEVITFSRLIKNNSCKIIGCVIKNDMYVSTVPIGIFVFTFSTTTDESGESVPDFIGMNSIDDTVDECAQILTKHRRRD
jgi:hypothetical protein